MIAAAKRSLPWLSGLLSYLIWRAGGLVCGPRPRTTGPITGRACVIQVNSVGDVLMATPLLRSLIGALGPGKVDVVVTRRTAALVENLPGVGRIFRLPGPLRWRHPPSVLGYLRLVGQLRSQRYEAVLDTSGLMQTAWMAFLTRARRTAGLRLGRQLGPLTVPSLGYLFTDETAVGPNAHRIRQNLALLASLDIPAASEQMRLALTAADLQAAEAWLAARGLGGDRALVAVHPGAKWPPKRWHAERFRLLVQRLSAQGMDVVLLGDKGDLPLLRAVADGTAPPPHLMGGDLSLGGTGALLRRASLLIGNDSGLMHLASAMGTPVLALFGPTCPERTGPLGPSSRALVKPIACRPCRLYFTRDRCERGHNYCMDLIEADEVASLAHSLVREAGSHR